MRWSSKGERTCRFDDRAVPYSVLRMCANRADAERFRQTGAPVGPAASATITLPWPRCKGPGTSAWGMKRQVLDTCDRDLSPWAWLLMPVPSTRHIHPTPLPCLYLPSACTCAQQRIAEAGQSAGSLGGAPAPDTSTESSLQSSAEIHHHHQFQACCCAIRSSHPLSLSSPLPSPRLTSLASPSSTPLGPARVPGRERCPIRKSPIDCDWPLVPHPQPWASSRMSSSSSRMSSRASTRASSASSTAPRAPRPPPRRFA